jgi:redox-sensing transcriptional repressor
MPTYLHKLMELHAEGAPSVSTTVLANYMNLESIVVRKDLEITGISGQPGVGYKTDELIAAIRNFLGWNNIFEACLVGAGSLGSALLGYEGFEEYGLRISLVFDADPCKIGTSVHGRKIQDISRMSELLKPGMFRLGMICVPTAYAQETADQLVANGITAIWNFANVSLQVPDGVAVQREVIAGGFALLSVKIAQLDAVKNGGE